MDNAGDFAKSCKDHFHRMLDSKVSEHPLVVLKCLRQAKAITQPHLETSIQFLAEREVKTEYDMLNLLTDSAKTIHPLQHRQEAESNALRIGMSGGGFSGYATGRSLDELNVLV